MGNANGYPETSPSSARTVRDGVEIAYVRAGAGRLPAAAAARLAGDEAHLVAQHRAAGRRGLRGDRARPARVRRLGPRPRRLLRPGDARARPARARARRARPRALRGGRRRRRRRRDPGPRPALRGLRRAPVPVQHRAARRCRTQYEQAGIAARRSRARCGWRPTTSCARAATPTGSPPSSTRPTSAAATSRSSTARASGRRRARSPTEDVDFMTEPFADAGQAARELRHLRVGARARGRRPSRRASSRPTRCRRWCSTGPTTT